MRIYTNFTEALNEIARDLKEMGLKVKTSTYQDKFIANDPKFETLELMNYDYTVVNPRLEDLNPSQPWCEREWRERELGIEGRPLNPGIAWEDRPEVWREFIQPNGKFGYSYGERFAAHHQVDEVINTLRKDPMSRQAFISVWNPSDSALTGGRSRIPCTLGYHLMIRGGELHITYMQRSADFATHFNNDLYLACKLQLYASAVLDIPVGRFTHIVFSLHVFAKDVEGVF